MRLETGIGPGGQGRPLPRHVQSLIKEVGAIGFRENALFEACGRRVTVAAR